MRVFIFLVTDSFGCTVPFTFAVLASVREPPPPSARPIVTFAKCRRVPNDLSVQTIQKCKGADDVGVRMLV